MHQMQQMQQVQQLQQRFQHLAQTLRAPEAAAAGLMVVAAAAPRAAPDLDEVQHALAQAMEIVMAYLESQQPAQPP